MGYMDVGADVAIPGYTKFSGGIPGQCGDPQVWEWWVEQTQRSNKGRDTTMRPPQSATVRPPWGTVPNFAKLQGGSARLPTPVKPAIQATPASARAFRLRPLVAPNVPVTPQNPGAHGMSPVFLTPPSPPAFGSRAPMHASVQAFRFDTATEPRYKRGQEIQIADRLPYNAFQSEQSRRLVPKKLKKRLFAPKQPETTRIGIGQTNDSAAVVSALVTKDRIRDAGESSFSSMQKLRLPHPPSTPAKFGRSEERQAEAHALAQTYAGMRHGGRDSGTPRRDTMRSVREPVTHKLEKTFLSTGFQCICGTRCSYWISYVGYR